MSVSVSIDILIFKDDTFLKYLQKNLAKFIRVVIPKQDGVYTFDNIGLPRSGKIIQARVVLLIAASRLELTDIYSTNKNQNSGYFISKGTKRDQWLPTECCHIHHED